MRLLGEKVLLARTKLRLSQDAVARAVGKSHGWLSLVERGLIDRLALEDVYALARVLELDRDEMTRLAGFDEPAAGPVGRRITLTEGELEALLRRAVVQGVAEALGEAQDRRPRAVEGEHA